MLHSEAGPAPQGPPSAPEPLDYLPRSEALPDRPQWLKGLNFRVIALSEISMRAGARQGSTFSRAPAYTHPQRPLVTWKFSPFSHCRLKEIALTWGFTRVSRARTSPEWRPARPSGSL